MEEVIENFGLVKMMDEVEEGEQLSVHEAKRPYESMKEDVESSRDYSGQTKPDVNL